MFETCQDFTMKNNKKGFFIDNLEHFLNWVGCFYEEQWSSDLVRVAGKDYVNVKSLWPVCAGVGIILQKTKTQSLYFCIFLF